MRPVVILLGTFLTLGAQEPEKPSPVVPGLPISEVSLTDIELRGILVSACPTPRHVENAGGQRQYVCDICPVGTHSPSFEGDSARIGHVVAGHFTAPGAEERLVWFWGCGAIQNPGFSVLFQKNGTRWRKVWLSADDSALARCWVHPRLTGRDLLICYSGLWSRGFGDSGPVQIELDNHGIHERGDLLYGVLSNAVTLDNLVTETEERATLMELNGDAIPDLRVVIVVHQGQRPLGYPSTQTFMPPVVSRQTLDFLYRDGLFYPTPETTRAKAVLQEFWTKGNPDGKR